MTARLPKWIEDAAQNELGTNSTGALETLAARLNEAGVAAEHISHDDRSVGWGNLTRSINQGRAFQAVFDLLKDIEDARGAVEAERARATAIGDAARERAAREAEAKKALERKLPDI